jgi:hypothetical protein
MSSYIGGLITLIYGLIGGATPPPPPTFYRITDDVAPNIRITDDGNNRIVD